VESSNNFSLVVLCIQLNAYVIVCMCHCVGEIIFFLHSLFYFFDMKAVQVCH
jgi:hypothetical protein